MKLRITVLILFSLQVNFTFSQIRDPRPKDQANVYWDGTYPLYSLVSDKQILPRKNGNYIYYATTNENPIPYEHTVRKGDVYYEYKFISYEECLEFCNQVRVSKGMPILIDEDQGGEVDDFVLEEMEEDEITVRNLKQSNTETNSNHQQRSFPNLTFPTEIISHDPNRNFFKDFINNQDIGKNLINNPYNVGDELIIKNVDTIVKRINKNLSLLSNDLANIRKSLPNSEKKLNTLQSVRNKIQNTQENIYLNNHQYDFYKLLNPKKASRILKNYSSAVLFENPNYNIYLYKKRKSSNGFSYYCRFVYINVPAHDGCIEIKQDEWEKLERKILIEKVEDNLKRDFLFENYGTTEKEYLDFELFNLLKKDSINLSKNKQDIFGYTYIGQVENGVRSGFGTLVNLFQDTVYKGIWKDDMPYQGQFYQFNYENKCFGNCDNGVGLKLMNSDCVYRGGFKDGKRNGKGEYIFKPNYDNNNNNYMISTFTNGKEGTDRKDYSLKPLRSETNNLIISKHYNGNIVFYSKTEDEDGYHKVLRIYNYGQIYTGYIKGDLDKGTTYFQNGYIFIGSSNRFDGTVESSGIKIELNSDGSIDILTGQFTNMNLNGDGMINYASGEEKKGIFENGKFIKSYDQIAQENLQLIESEKRKEQEKIDQEKMKWENLAKLMREAREAEIAYQNSPQGKAEKLYHDTHCANCSKKLGQYKYQGFFSTIDGPHCFADLEGKRDPNGGWLFRFEKGFFCSYECAMNKCEKEHGIK